MQVLAIDLGGTKLSIALFSPEGIKSASKVIPLNGLNGQKLGDFIATHVIEYTSSNPVRAIAISIPGIADKRSGTVWAPNIPGWDNYPLQKEIEAVAENIPVLIESDRSCYILGEVWKGHAAGAKHAIFIAVGTGIGAGILIDGKVLRGSAGIAGAIGWMAVQSPFNQKYASCGCFEGQASGHGIASLAREIMGMHTGYTGQLSQINPDKITAHEILAAYETNDPIARETIMHCIELWGMVTANLISLFNPEIILFGGGVFGPAVKFIDQIKEETRKWAQPVSFEQCEIKSSLLGPEAGLYGAGYLGLNLLSINSINTVPVD